jgi:hypothetical protein
MYQLTKPIFGTAIASVVNTENNTLIPFDPDNTDYQAYLEWVAEGNTPLPADEVTQ